jgi:nucleoside-diphosphate-sugar epimerase
VRIGVTGANGYVGTVVRQRLAADGHEAVAFARSAVPGDDVADPSAVRPFDLRRPPGADLLGDLDALVHCAWDLSLVSEGDVWGVNVAGTERLLRNAVDAGVGRTVLISSMSAYAGTRQLYGLSKLACERTAASLGAVTARPGLVYGPGWGGMIGALRKMTRLPITPLIGSRSHQFTAHEDDVAAAIVRLATAPSVPTVPLGLAHPDPIGFGELLETIAALDGRRIRTVPLPYPPVYGALRVGELLRLPLPFRADSIHGLVHPAPGVPGIDEVRDLGIEFRAFSPSD